jgi:hypothetical protein
MSSDIDIKSIVSESALQFLANSKKKRQAQRDFIAEAAYQILVVPGGDDPKNSTADSLETLLAKLSKLDGSDAQVFVFAGQRVQFTKGPKRMLVLSETQAVNIETGLTYTRIEDESPFDLQKDGFMGDPLLYTLIPKERAEDDDEEDFREEDSGSSD